MPTFYAILIALILVLFWKSLTLIYLIRKAHAGMLTPLRFTVAFTLGFSITVSAILIIIFAVDGITLNKFGFVIFMFALNFIIGFPVVFYLSRYVMRKYFSEWGSQLNEVKNG